MKTPILNVKNLEVEFATLGGTVNAVRGVSFQVHPGEVLAIVGESGSGKSVTCQSLMGLIPCPPGKITGGSAELDGADILKMSEREMQSIRGASMSMIFQDPLTSLNPTMSVGDQIAEVIVKHRGFSSSKAKTEVLDLMNLVQIPEPKARYSQYPHEFSGGMRQRIMIAIALACRPKVLIADEPTTALDVTIQGQILELINNLRREINMAVILITHDLGVVAAVADRVAVMYAGEIVETGSVEQIFSVPSHPYTKGLQEAIPNPMDKSKTELVAIYGSPPDLFSPPKGCAFAARCKYTMEVCTENSPPIFEIEGNSEERYSACWLHHSSAPKDMKGVVHAK
jgi:oligopeptide transport system ATP-binding protein